MAVFTPDAEFGGDNRSILRQADGTSRVAGETAEDRGLRIENPVAHSSRPNVARCAPISIELRVPALIELQVIPSIHAAHERYGLLPGTECPFARLRGFRAGECFGVRSSRLRGVLRRMTRIARRRPGVVCCGNGQK